MLRWMMILALWSCQHHSHCMHKHMFIFLFRIIYETRRTTTEQSLFHAINKSWPGRAAIHLPNVFTIENSLLAFSFHFAHWKWNEMNVQQQHHQHRWLLPTNEQNKIKTLQNKHDNHLNIHFQSFSHSNVWHMNAPRTRVGRRRRRCRSRSLAPISQMPKQIQRAV